MKRIRIIGLVLLVLILLSVIIWHLLPKRDKNLYDARVMDGHFQIFKDGEWEPMTLKGVNLGMGKPGAFPGEAAITEEEYYRWFEYIGNMNANVIRVYTLHPPGFYNSLHRYNENHDEKLYVIHGVWTVSYTHLDVYKRQLQDYLTEFPHF